MIGRLFIILMLGAAGLCHSTLASGEMSEDGLRMKEHLIALSQGKGTVAALHIEVVDGTPMTATGMSIYDIADGKVVSRKWNSIGSTEKHDERAVTDEAVRQLLRDMVEKQYWNFQGTEFIIDGNEFMFRIHDIGLQPVEYRCQAQEYQKSRSLSAIRSVLLSFVSGAQ